MRVSAWRSDFFELRTLNFELRSLVSLPLHALIAALSLIAGCTGISIAPSCPNELQVGESAPLLADELHPGAIAKYTWEVIPSYIGRVVDPDKPTTVFEALSEGDARIQLTASDGLYQVVSFCTTRVAGFAEQPDDNTNANDNSSDNTNANENGSTNDNRPEVPDRPGGVRKERP